MTTPAPGAHVSDRWAHWRATVDLVEYETRWDRLEASGEAPHGEADLVESFRPGSVLDAGCGMGRVAIELDRRGIDVAGADLDDDLLAVARRHAPHVTWRCADLAADPLGGPYDAIVMAGNVMIFCRREARAPIVANVAAHLAPGGHLIAGFSLDPDPDALTVAEYEAACTDAGLVVVDRWATWERRPFTDTDDYLVSVAVRPRAQE